MVVFMANDERLGKSDSCLLGTHEADVVVAKFAGPARFSLLFQAKVTFEQALFSIGLALEY
jgi:hypothetical protein